MIITVNQLSYSQDSLKYKLILDIPILDFPENIDLPQKFPSMNQASKWSTDFYELGYWGLDELGDRIFINKYSKITNSRKALNKIFKYSLGLAFSKYGSELPIPLGVWAHEEFHRTTLGVTNIKSKNGNWIFQRWDGTVYGISDESLDNLKNLNINQLLYSYVAGVQYEIYLNQNISLNDFYLKRYNYKNSLLLYNAYYVYNYFKFSTSPFSDSVKIIAPKYEDSNPINRDFAGADLNAWVYDMFNPSLPFTSRDTFPNGDGVNRRIGFSDLSDDEQNYLLKQKKLSLLNFLNPSIFFINRINISDNFSFNLFFQYIPTNFGNNISLIFPFKYKKYDFLISFNRFDNDLAIGNGYGFGLYNYDLSKDIDINVSANIWNQPKTFMTNSKIFGGSLNTKIDYSLPKNMDLYLELNYKSKGWLIGNPYLKSTFYFGGGINFKIKK